MQLTVLVENFCQNQKLRSEWGYSLYLSDPSTELLLDTGGYQHSLVHNASVLGLKWQNLQHIVLSHGHFDHTAGLMDAIRLAPQAQIWAGPNIEKPRWSDANQARNGGGGKLFSKVIDHTINPWAQITPSVIAFTVPEPVSYTHLTLPTT